MDKNNMLKLSVKDIRQINHTTDFDGYTAIMLKHHQNNTFDLGDVLKLTNIEYAIHCLHCFNFTDYCLFLADIAELIIPSLTNKSCIKVCYKSIQSIRDYKSGQITKNQLRHFTSGVYIKAAHIKISLIFNVNSDHINKQATYAVACCADCLELEFDDSYVNINYAVDMTKEALSLANIDDYSKQLEQIENLFHRHFNP